MQDNPDKRWNYILISANPNITWKIVQDNPDKDWSYWIFANPNITWKIVQENPDKDWNYCYLSMDLNITWKIICSRHELAKTAEDDRFR